MRINLRIWRQESAAAKGHFENYTVESISPDMSFLEMLDTLNEDLLRKGKEPVALDRGSRDNVTAMLIGFDGVPA